MQQSFRPPSPSDPKKLSKKVILIGCIALLVGILAFATIMTRNGRQQGGIDIVHDYDWSHANGVSSMADTLEVTGLDRRIVNQDGTGGTLNTPINLYASPLSITGDFEASAIIHNAEGSPAIQLYGEAPVIYDEWRQENRSVRIVYAPDHLDIQQYGNRKYKRTYQLAAPRKENFSLRIQHIGKTIVLWVNGARIGSFSNSSVFSSGKIWLGLDDAQPGAKWSTKELIISPLGGGKVSPGEPLNATVAQPTADALKTLISKKNGNRTAIGAAIASGPLLTDARYRALALNEFSIFTPENEMKAQFIHPSPDTYAFSDADTIVETRT